MLGVRSQYCVGTSLDVVGRSLHRFGSGVARSMPRNLEWVWIYMYVGLLWVAGADRFMLAEDIERCTPYLTIRNMLGSVLVTLGERG